MKKQLMLDTFGTGLMPLLLPRVRLGMIDDLNSLPSRPMYESGSLLDINKAHCPRQ